MTRTTFTVSRAAEFFSEKELEMQMGASAAFLMTLHRINQQHRQQRSGMRSVVAPNA